MNSPKIVTLPKTELVGSRIITTLAKNETRMLWEKFQKLLIAHNVPKEIPKYSIQIFDQQTSFSNMTAQTQFEKWAAIESQYFPNPPQELETTTISGKYAVFVHKGLPSDFPKTAAFIYGEWIPNSDFTVDRRQHFEILPPTYRPNDPMAQEEVWVPIKKK